MSGKDVKYSDIPELMGAFGAALVALADEKGAKAVAKELRSKGYPVEEKLDIVLSAEWVYENFREKVEKAIEENASLLGEGELF